MSAASGAGSTSGVPERSPIIHCRGEHLGGRQFRRQGNLPDGDPHRLNRARHIGTLLGAVHQLAGIQIHTAVAAARGFRPVCSN